MSSLHRFIVRGDRVDIASFSTQMPVEALTYVYYPEEDEVFIHPSWTGGKKVVAVSASDELKTPARSLYQQTKEQVVGIIEKEERLARFEERS